MGKPLPKYLEPTPVGVFVTLSKPVELGGVTQGRIMLREPLVIDSRQANKGADDEEQAEMNLFAALAGVNSKELEGLHIKDYSRVQAGYFFLVQEEQPKPDYLDVTLDGVTVTLSKKTDLNGIPHERIVFRAPTVRDVRTAQATAGGDAEQREISLFASLAEVGCNDLDGLRLKDYTRLQAGYFRMVQDDGL